MSQSHDQALSSASQNYTDLDYLPSGAGTDFDRIAGQLEDELIDCGDVETPLEIYAYNYKNTNTQAILAEIATITGHEYSQTEESLFSSEIEDAFNHGSALAMNIASQSILGRDDYLQTVDAFTFDSYILPKLLINIENGSGASGINSMLDHGFDYYENGPDDNDRVDYDYDVFSNSIEQVCNSLSYSSDQSYILKAAFGLVRMSLDDILDDRDIEFESIVVGSELRNIS